MKKINEKQILHLILKKLGEGNPEPYFGKDDISMVSLNNFFNKNKSFSLAITCDMLVEHTDVPPGMTFKQIARKSIISCISDLCVKGIKPELAMISLGIPSYLTKPDINELIDGFYLSSKEYDYVIIGGDINESKELVIDCCMIGFSTDNLTIPRRNGAMEDHYVVVSGSFGYTSSGLKILMENSNSPNNLFKKKSINSVVYPIPSYRFGLLLSKYFSSTIDSSDGLASSLYQIAKESNFDMVIYKEKIPIPTYLPKFAQLNHLNLDDLIFYGGEEYVLVGTISKKNLLKLNKYAEKHDLSYYIIGRIIRGSGKVFLISSPNSEKRILLKDKGFTHLS